MLKINVGVTWYYTFGIVLLLHSNYNQPQVGDAIDQTGIFGVVSLTPIRQDQRAITHLT